MGWSDEITTIALYDGWTIRHYVQGHNLHGFLHDVQACQLLVTYNGKTFDVLGGLDGPRLYSESWRRLTDSCCGQRPQKGSNRRTQLCELGPSLDYAEVIVNQLHGYSPRSRRRAVPIQPLPLPFAKTMLLKQPSRLLPMPCPTVVFAILGPALPAQSSLKRFLAGSSIVGPQAKFLQFPTDHVASRAQYAANLLHGQVITVAHFWSFLCSSPAWQRVA